MVKTLKYDNPESKEESLLFTLKLLIGAIKALLFKSGLQKPNTVQVKVCSFWSCTFLALCSSEHTCARENTFFNLTTQ